MSTWTEVFGPVFTTDAVEKSILALAEEWFPTYVNVISEEMGLGAGKVLYPKAYQKSYDLDNYPEGNFPVFVVVCDGTLGDFEREAGGEIGAWFGYEISVL